MLADHLLVQPGVADRLTWRICATFLGEDVADLAARRELAGQLRGDDLHVGRAVATILHSSLFFSARNLHARVSDPVGFVVGSVRALERFDPPPSTLLLAEWTGRLGQELFTHLMSAAGQAGGAGFRGGPSSRVPISPQPWPAAGSIPMPHRPIFAGLPHTMVSMATRSTGFGSIASY